MLSDPLFLAWGSEFELGIPELDAQHRSLIDLANRLYAELKKEQRGDGATLAIPELFDYTTTHFAYEESYFRRFNLPSLAAHVEQHAAFIERVGNFKERLLKGSPAETAEILAFLQAWIKRHIGKDDRALVRIARRAQHGENPIGLGAMPFPEAGIINDLPQG